MKLNQCSVFEKIVYLYNHASYQAAVATPIADFLHYKHLPNPFWKLIYLNFDTILPRINLNSSPIYFLSLDAEANSFT